MQSVYIVDGARTPFLKARGKIGPFTGSDLGVLASRQLLARQPFSPDELSEVITGCVMPSPDEANISRYISLRVGCGNSVPAWTVQRNCASGMQAVDTAYQNILAGRSKITLAGGTDAMSHAPLLYNAKMTNWLSAVMTAKTPVQRLAMLPKFRPGFLAPVIALMKGLTDNYVGLNMGQTAEEVAYRFDISREEMDRFAVQSHKRVVAAQESGALNEIEPIIDYQGKAYELDDGVRVDSSVEKLAKLRPFFDKKFGKVTAANSSQVTDGAAFMILADEKSVKKYDLPVIARIVDTEWAALNPSQMGLGPVHAMTPLLKRNKLGIKDIDYFEINEAFAAQVLGCIKAWEDKAYCKDELGLSKPFGTIPEEKLNVDGGAIALGHPVGASGARITLHLAELLQRKEAKYGLASICIGGGQGGAVLIERV
jgi:acetyl-CoA C-acetyltransferase